MPQIKFRISEVCPDPIRATAVEEVLTTHWDRIAAFAYERYLADGKGAIVFNLSGLPGLSEVKFWHVPLKAIEAATQNASHDDVVHNIKGQVQSYDPDEEMVVVFGFDKNDALHLKLRQGWLENKGVEALRSPKQAYTQARLRGLAP